jgi:hypothetical protein
MARPPKMKGKCQLVAFRLPQTLLRRLDRYTQQIHRDGKPRFTRADALRFLLDWALDTLEQDRVEQKQMAQELQALFADLRLT